MVEIQTSEGLYKYDPSTELISKNGTVLGDNIVEPVYTITDDNVMFSGLFFKGTGKLLSLNGNFNSVVDSKQL